MIPHLFELSRALSDPVVPPPLLDLSEAATAVVTASAAVETEVNSVCLRLFRSRRRRAPSVRKLEAHSCQLDS